MTNTSRTLKYLRDRGWKAGVVERFLFYAGKYGKRIDLFNIIDIIALSDTDIIGVQSCGQSFGEHDKKILASPLAERWLGCGGKLMLVGWRKLLKKRGGKLRVWKPRIKHYHLRDFI